MKKTLIALLFLLITADCHSQQEQKNFLKTRKTDFTKLLGYQTNIEGIKLVYNNEKTFIEGTFGKPIKDSRVLVQVGGTIGTTTNLSDLFSQDLLPSVSLLTAVNILLPGSSWYYDKTFTSNYYGLQDPLIDITTLDTEYHFKYRKELREKIIANQHPAKQELYTHKRLFWITATAQYDNSKYSIYAPERAFASQKYDTTYQSFSGKINLNAYWFWNKADVKWTKPRPNFVFLTGYLRYELGNNINQLRQVNVTDITETVIHPTTNTTRQITNTQSRYLGQYKEYHTMTPGVELIIAPLSFAAVDLFGEYNFITDAKKNEFNTESYGSYGAGLFFYTNSGNAASKFNIGIFYKMVENSENKWDGLFGIKTSIPFTPL